MAHLAQMPFGRFRPALLKGVFELEQPSLDCFPGAFPQEAVGGCDSSAFSANQAAIANSRRVRCSGGAGSWGRVSEAETGAADVLGKLSCSSLAVISSASSGR
jgi:hypothetical protein